MVLRFERHPIIWRLFLSHAQMWHATNEHAF